jgi:hypothetical protein
MIHFLFPLVPPLDSFVPFFYLSVLFVLVPVARFLCRSRC